MSADPADLRGRSSAREAAGPIYFRSGNRALFGWIHWPAAGSAADLGVVICKPFGFEAICSHLSVRAFAEAVSALGIPTLRFDYAGTGDSEDLDPGSNQVEVWRGDIIAACEELRRRSGVERLCLLGVRLGATLAALAAPSCKGVDAIAALAPLPIGKRYLRELRTFEMAASHLDVSTGAAEPPQRLGEGPLEVSGFLLSAESIAALSAIDLTAAAESPPREMLIIDRSDLPAARSWADRSSSRGSRVSYLTMSGFVEMLMRPPDLTVTPSPMIEEVCAWLRQLAQESGREGQPGCLERPRADDSDAPAAVLVLGRESGDAISDRPVFIADDPPLFGILSEPAGNEKRRRGVILLNSGGDYHVGPRGMYVSLARRWSARGYLVLRMDLAGLGESATHAGRPGNEIFPPSAIEDIRKAVDFLRNRRGVRDITLAGVCTGAYHALQAAIEGIPVNRLLLVNQLNFFREEGEDPENIQQWELVHKPAAYNRQIFSAKAWKRLLTRDVNLLRVLKIYFSSPWLAMLIKLRTLARRLGIPLHNDLARELARLEGRGVRVAFVYSRGDAGISLLSAQTGLASEELAKRYRLRLIEQADHNLTRSAARARLAEVLSEELFARSESALR
jgi:dienelactone hydrolase